MAEVVYALCAGTSLLCFSLLVRAYRRNRSGLLLWSSIAFLCFALGNALLFVDLVVLPQVDLMIYRTLLNLLGAGLLLARLIRNAVNERT
jgi:hypothetical protein